MYIYMEGIKDTTIIDVLTSTAFQMMSDDTDDSNGQFMTAKLFWQYAANKLKKLTKTAFFSKDSQLKGILTKQGVLHLTTA